VRLFAKTNFDFMRIMPACVIGSLVLNAIALGIFFTKGVNKGIDFTGGTEVQVQLGAAPDLGAVRAAIERAGLASPTVTTIGEAEDEELYVRVAASESAAGGVAEKDTPNRIVEAVKTTIPAGTAVTLRSQNYVGPSVAPELRQKAIWAVVLSILAMLAYIWFRFRFQWGLGAILALIHDVIFTLGLFCLSGLEFSLPVVASFLTLVGYSVNDTIVVFDRIREIQRARGAGNLPRSINEAINQTLSRTLITSFLTWLVCAALFFFGGEALRGFSFVLVIGIIVGTYSSIYIASPVIILWERVFRGGKPAAAAGERGRTVPAGGSEKKSARR